MTKIRKEMNNHNERPYQQEQKCKPAEIFNSKNGSTSHSASASTIQVYHMLIGHNRTRLQARYLELHQSFSMFPCCVSV